MSDERDTLPPPTGRDPLEPTLRDVYEAQQAMGHQLSDLADAAKTALQALGSTVAEYYQREAGRNDEQDRRLVALEDQFAALDRRLAALEGGRGE